jgi:hypothetical protein
MTFIKETAPIFHGLEVGYDDKKAAKASVLVGGMTWE